MEREKQFLNYMVSVSREEKSFRVGGRRTQARNIFWASLQFTLNSWRVSLSIKKKKRKRKRKKIELEKE